MPLTVLVAWLETRNEKNDKMTTKRWLVYSNIKPRYSAKIEDKMAMFISIETIRKKRVQHQTINMTNARTWNKNEIQQRAVGVRRNVCT